MPIYEFFCKSCNTIFSFLSRRVNSEARPDCPKCGGQLQRRPSAFATVGKAKEPSDDLLSGIDENRMEQVMGDLAREAEKLNQEDPRQMARLMRRFSEKIGLDFSGSMAEALERLEAGEDPESIEAELGDILESEDMPFELRKETKASRPQEPERDETLYEL